MERAAERSAERAARRSWGAVFRRTFREIISDRVSLVAAGCAFYATLALFPALTTLIFVYGLAFDPITVEPHLRPLQRLLPPEVFGMISTQVHALVEQRRSTLGAGVLISLAVTLWSSATGTKSMLSALNMAYKQRETRGFLRFQATGFGMTLIAILGAVLGLAILVALPTAIQILWLSAYATALLNISGFAVLVLYITGGLALLYRLGPSRRPRSWLQILPGTLAAALLWVIASALFSLYVARIATYNVTYGPLGAAAGMMMWFYVSVYVVLLGAELNAAIEVHYGGER